LQSFFAESLFFNTNDLVQISSFGVIVPMNIRKVAGTKQDMSARGYDGSFMC
jgi:hypothetical protein